MTGTVTRAEAGQGFDVADVSLRDVLSCEQLDAELFRCAPLFAPGTHLYGGQVAAQALLAGGMTVAPERPPHSVHLYFLRPGDAGLPTVFRVNVDRDGGSFSARRVTAMQNGEVLLTASMSFQVPVDGLDTPGPVPVQPPTDNAVKQLSRLVDIDAVLDEQDPGAKYWGRFWVRTPCPLPVDPLSQAAALVYASDISSGLGPLVDKDTHAGASLDHAVWFHRPCDLTSWTLIDLEPRTIQSSRGFYTGSFRDSHGRLVASLAQESLMKRPRR